MRRYCTTCFPDIRRRDAKQWAAEHITVTRDLRWYEGTVKIVEGIARAVAKAGQSQEAVRLLAAAGALRRATQNPLRPAEQSEYDRVVAAVREALGVEAFEALWTEGAALSPEQAIAAALATR